DLAHVVWAVNLGCLGFHVWPFRAADPEHCDELRLDLDPQPGTGFDDIRRAAKELKALLDELGVAGYPKTTGNRGLHVYVRLQPRWDSYEVRSAAVAVARELERRRPDILTAAWWKEERGERVFVDYNQNARDRTVASAYSVRPTPDARVSCPITWDEVPDVEPRELRLDTVPDRLRTFGDPAADIDEHAGRLDALHALADRDEAGGLGDAPWPPHFARQRGEPKRVQPSRDRDRPRATQRGRAGDPQPGGPPDPQHRRPPTPGRRSAPRTGQGDEDEFED
ncbi:MAG: DNA polymerase domain-containing protein, partial [Solirubrobacteraceae bacterium]